MFQDQQLDRIMRNLEFNGNNQQLSLDRSLAYWLKQRTRINKLARRRELPLLIFGNTPDSREATSSILSMTRISRTCKMLEMITKRWMRRSPRLNSMTTSLPSFMARLPKLACVSPLLRSLKTPMGPYREQQ